jgi:DNA-3-methyladenine glycosylase
MKLQRSFYSRKSAIVARSLLGKILVHKTRDGVLKGMIVETEAYFGHKDPGSHAFNGITPRNKIMYQRPGIAYVYFTYGNHWMLNVVAEKEGVPGAVLIRALEPLKGVEIMKKNRGIKDVSNLTNGPGKLTQAMEIDKRYNGKDITGGSLFIEGSKRRFHIVTTTRIGLTRGGGLPLRFYINENEFVSRK